MRQVEPFPTAKTASPTRIFSVPQPLPSGRMADEKFLDEVIANWNDYQEKGDPRFPNPPAYLIPAASISVGHEVDSSIAKNYAQRTDLPAVGWPEGLYRDGPYLMATFRHVPEQLAKWIESKAYSSISSEFYEDYQNVGACLRRVSILGAAIPQCKDLGDMPTFVYEEDNERQKNPIAFAESIDLASRSHKRFAFAGPDGFQVVTFSEEDQTTNNTPRELLTMNPTQQAVVTALQNAGVDVSKIDASVIDQIITACTPAAAAPMEPTANAEEPTEKEPAKCAEGDDDMEDKAAKFAEMVDKAVERKFGLLKSTVDKLQTSHAKAIRERDRMEIAAFCEKNKNKIFPSEMNSKVGPTLTERLLNLSADTVVKFGEGETTIEKSPRQAEMDAIANRPDVARFAEKMPDPKDAAPAHKSDVARMLSHDHVGKAVLKSQAN